MIPFIHDTTGAKKKPTLKENLRGFKIVAVVLIFVLVAYVTIALLVFGEI
ncbi:MAG: hypothetical protein JNK10_10910 [Cyclobacteriaceae bacterium]|nr:hypothetical protein [Cyclobacteriaceae bacterium]